MPKLMPLLFALCVFTMALIPVRDVDFGWHYRCGTEFLRQGKLCVKNEYSYYLPGYVSHNLSFIYDISLAAVYDIGGFAGVALLGAGVITLSYICFKKLVDVPEWLSCATFTAVYFLSASVFNAGLRSQVATYAFFMMALYLLHNAKKDNRYLYSYPLLMFLWVNTHIGFFIGLLLYAAEFFAWGRKRIYWVFGLFSLLATIVNPFGLLVFKSPLDHFTSPMSSMIAEWTPPVFYLQALILLTYFIALALLFREGRRNWGKAMLLTIMLVLAVAGRRNVPFFFTLSAVTALSMVKKGYKSLGDFVLIPMVSAAIIFCLLVNLPILSGFDYCRDSAYPFPCQAVEKIGKNLSGNVFNTYEWGGYMIWKMPQIKVFSDGRMPAWKDGQGRSPYQVFLQILQGQPGWNDKLRKSRTDYIFIASGTFLDMLLVDKKEQGRYGWQEIYRDQKAVVYENSLKK